LVVALHGLYSNPQQIMRYPGLIEQAEKYGYLVVAPMGFNNHGWYGARMLVKGREDDPKNLTELSEQDVMNVLERVRKDYNVDPDRIYLCGHSMGGGGAWHLAVKYPSLWAALAPIAPAPVVLPLQAEKFKHLPVILVQGDADLLVKVEWVRPWADRMKELGMDYQYIEVPGGDHITVAFKNLPQIFAFFDKHKRGEEKAAAGAKKDE
jgi:poly(3-hydroxybutyrate) depolymerase